MASTMGQIRNVPPEFNSRLKARAALEWMSMSDYILRESANHSSDRRARKCWSDCAPDPSAG